MPGALVQLVPVDAVNWRALAQVSCAPGQEAFVAPVTYYLCLCHYGGQWQPWAIVADGAVVGHAMWARDEDGSTWLGGLVIDAAEQQKGYGRAAVSAFIERFTSDVGEVHVALSYAADNRIARDLYRELGFVETGEIADDEIVARLVRHRTP